MQNKSPKHIAIIMDGNGRWAKARRLPRTAGHKKGVDRTKEIVRHAGEIGLQYLTLYAFSTENWSRPQDEVNDLMGLLRYYMKSEAAELHKNNVRLRVIGSRERLSQDILDMVDHIEDLTGANDGLNLTIALDYGGRQEILSAVKKLITSSCGSTTGSGDANTKDPAITSQDDDKWEKEFSKHLYTANLPDPDLLIRTSGEQRISNFLLWQCAYSEFYFTDTLWPDFTPEEFDKAITDYNNRDRRFGGIDTQEEGAQ